MPSCPVHILCAAILVAVTRLHSTACAQAPYANTHIGRPLRVGDAVPEAAGEIELRLLGFRLDRPDNGPAQWRADPAISLALSGRTSIEVGASFLRLDRPDGAQSGLSGFDIGVFHLLTAGLPRRTAIGIAVDAFVPAGPLGSGGVWTQVRTVATYTQGSARLHLNSALGQYRVDVVDAGATCSASTVLIKLGLTCDGVSPPVLPGGPCASVASKLLGTPPLLHCMRADAAFVSDTTILIVPVIRSRSGVRWFSGAAVDYNLSRWSTLVMGDVVVSRLVGLQSKADWSAEAGLRRQATKRGVFDVGVARRFAGARPGWSWFGGFSWSLGATS
jgi:hypothetical protein